MSPWSVLVCARWLCWAWILAGCASCWSAFAQGPVIARESAVKAAFLYKFGSFVEWPPGSFRSPAAPFVIGVYGDDAVASELEQVTQGRSIEGHPVSVLRIRDLDDLPAMHVLYVGGVRESRIRDALAAARGAVLTVTDGPAGGRHPPVLHFTQEDGKVRFAASLQAAAARGLKLSARLLAVAQQVEGR